ncbi:hypothetical protein amb1512 [Paramagnetospirillum magneticum AMB-1]|uniref:Uncharacterized protein n=1 Tax=Paramagnetospirillum magneticum (strain ATCC 700264 / AMB-1) TaxID=342108 RepID=Q2W759_PARM1|nr:hypothetical protein amb1512 [Paramagnetospirillum magneticum AMB-1]
MPRPFLLLVDFDGRLESRQAERLALGRLLPEPRILFAWDKGQAIGYLAEAMVPDHLIRDAIGERGQFVTMELASPGQWATDGFGEAHKWLSRHVGRPSARDRGKAP